MTEAQLRAFVAVAELGSFALAAGRLHLSQPGVSRAVKALEDELGAPLLVRAHGFVSLTPTGEGLLVRSRDVLAQLAAMRQDVDLHRGTTSGRVRLGSMPSVSATILPGLLAQVERRHPALEVTVIDGHDDELVGWVRDGTVDLAVVTGQPVGLACVPLADDEFLAVLPADDELASHPDVDPRDLAGRPFILTRAGCERLVLEVLARSGVAPDVHHEVTEASAILGMVSQHLGVSVMPSLAARHPPPSIALRLLRPRAERHLSISHRHDRAPTPAISAFLAVIAAWRTTDHPMLDPDLSNGD